MNLSSTIKNIFKGKTTSQLAADAFITEEATLKQLEAALSVANTGYMEQPTEENAKTIRTCKEQIELTRLRLQGAAKRIEDAQAVEAKEREEERAKAREAAAIECSPKAWLTEAEPIAKELAAAIRTVERCAKKLVEITKARQVKAAVHAVPTITDLHPWYLVIRERGNIEYDVTALWPRAHQTGESRDLIAQLTAKGLRAGTFPNPDQTDARNEIDDYLGKTGEELAGISGRWSERDATR